MPDEKKKDVSVDDATGTEILKAVKEQHTMTIERLDRSDTELKNMSDKVTDQATLIKSLEEKVRTRKASLPGVELEKEKFSIQRAIIAIKTGNWAGAGFEQNVFADTKAMGTGTGTGGGYLIPSQVLGDVIELQRANTVVIGLGATLITDLTGSPAEMPKQTGGATAYWTEENESITPSGLTFGQISLVPKAATALVKLSNRLLSMSSPAVESMIRRDIAFALALLIDGAALRGAGTKNEPLGIVNTSGINTVVIDTNGGTFTLDHAADMEGTLEDANALAGSLGFSMHGKVKRKLKKQKVAQFSGDTAGAYIMLPMSDSNLIDLLGYNLKTTTQIPTNLTRGSGTNLSEVIFGNWQELIIGQWGGLEIMASSETSDAFQKNQTWIRIIQEIDIALRHPESFCLINDAETV